MPGDGSNNWVIDGSLSATGMPLLANDPHRSIATPSLRYLVHLVAPEWNVIGSGEPALPGVAIGHNEHIGWGLTIVGIDQGDIFVEELHPEDDNRYMHNGDWAEFTGHTETIAVAGEEAREVTLKFGHHGPVILEDAENRRAYSFKTVLSEPGTAGYLGSLRVDQASSWEEYLEGMRGWKVPSKNMIYADTDGNIGWMAAGLTPLRDRHDGWTGRLPVPGDGSYEWQGFRDTNGAAARAQSFAQLHRHRQSQCDARGLRSTARLQLGGPGALRAFGGGALDATRRRLLGGCLSSACSTTRCRVWRRSG